MSLVLGKPEQELFKSFVHPGQPLWACTSVLGVGQLRRPKGIMSSELLRRVHRPTSGEVLDELWAIARDPHRNDSARVQAMRTILEVQGQIGRASFHLHARLERNPLMHVSNEELARLAAKAREALAEGSEPVGLPTASLRDAEDDPAE